MESFRGLTDLFVLPPPLLQPGELTSYRYVLECTQMMDSAGKEGFQGLIRLPRQADDIAPRTSFSRSVKAQATAPSQCVRKAGPSKLVRDFERSKF